MIMQQWHAATTTRHSSLKTFDLGLELLRDTQLGLPAILNNALGSRAGAVLAVPLFGLLTISRHGLYNRAEWHPCGGAQLM